MLISALKVNTFNNTVKQEPKSGLKLAGLGVQKDSFVKSTNVVDFNLAKNQISANNIGFRRNNPISFMGLTAPMIGKAILLNADNSPIIKRYDGGYNVDKETGTVVYYGIDAKRYLENITLHTQDTQIISQSGCKIAVTPSSGEQYVLNEPGAIMINKGNIASVEVLEGNPLVITTIKAPDWYEKFAPNSSHTGYFDTLAEKNKHIYSSEVTKQALGKNYEALEDAGIVKGSIDESYFMFNVDSMEELQTKLRGSHLPIEDAVEVIKLFKRCEMQTKKQPQSAGNISKLDFLMLENRTQSKLLKSKLISKNTDGSYQWTSFSTREDFENNLWQKTKAFGRERKEIIDLWDKSTRSGYDVSGLLTSDNGVTIYSHKGKLNPYSYAETEWITNSTAWTPSGAMDIGVSRVINGNEKSANRAFNDVRAEECIHKHQNPKNKLEKMTESYLLTQGKAAMYTSVNGKPEIKVLNAGDLYVIPSGVEHGIIAVDGEYEHLCFQTPSAFQYGFRFKSDTKPFSKPIISDAINTLDTKRDQESSAI